MSHLHVWIVILGLVQSAWTYPHQADPCTGFFEALDDVPHVTLTRGTAPFEPIWSSEPTPVCEVDFETNDATLAGASAPDFWPEPDTELYRAGWRMIPEVLADGAGSGVYGIQNRGVRCVIRWEQPAYIDDDGTLVQSDTFTLVLQCSGGGRP